MDPKSRADIVRCVRGEPSALIDGPRFVRTVPVTDQPVVEDRRTGYVWQGCPAGLTGNACAGGDMSTMSWEAVLAYCEGLSWGRRTDWYLPNVKELSSIVDDSRFGPGIAETVFPATPNEGFWSSSTCSPSRFYACFVSFPLGRMSSEFESADLYVRCVRRGP